MLHQMKHLRSNYKGFNSTLLLTNLWHVPISSHCFKSDERATLPYCVKTDIGGEDGIRLQSCVQLRKSVFVNDESPICYPATATAQLKKKKRKVCFMKNEKTKNEDISGSLCSKQWRQLKSDKHPSQSAISSWSMCLPNTYSKLGKVQDFYQWDLSPVLLPGPLSPVYFQGENANKRIDTCSGKHLDYFPGVRFMFDLILASELPNSTDKQ